MAHPNNGILSLYFIQERKATCVNAYFLIFFTSTETSTEASIHSTPYPTWNIVPQVGVGPKKGAPTFQPQSPGPCPQHQVVGGRMRTTEALLFLEESPPTGSRITGPRVLGCSHPEWSPHVTEDRRGLGSNTTKSPLSYHTMKVAFRATSRVCKWLVVFCFILFFSLSPVSLVSRCMEYHVPSCC